MRFQFSICAIAAGLLLLALPRSAAAQVAYDQSWPQRTVRIIVPVGPGTASDLAARLLAERQQKKWGQSVVVENRPGGDAIVAITAFIGAGDGHTLLYSPTSAFLAHPYMHAKMPYDLAALAPIARIATALIGVVVPSALGLSSMGDLVARARAEPGKLNYASSTGLTDFLLQAHFKTNNLNLVRVPYRDFVQALNDVSEGRVQVNIATYALARPMIEAGKVKMLALQNGSRSDLLRGTPTAREAGFPELEYEPFVGFFGPRDMPAQLRERIAADVIAAIKEPEISQRLTVAGVAIDPGTPAQFAATIEQQHRMVEGAANILGLKRAN